MNFYKVVCFFYGIYFQKEYLKHGILGFCKWALINGSSQSSNQSSDEANNTTEKFISNIKVDVEPYEDSYRFIINFDKKEFVDVVEILLIQKQVVKRSVDLMEFEMTLKQNIKMDEVYKNSLLFDILMEVEML